jgi:membrane protein
MLAQTLREWMNDNAMVHAAALAFYTMFSLAPLLIVTVSIAGPIFGEQAARGELQGQMQHYIGAAGAVTVQQILEEAERPAFGTVAGIIGLGILLIGASGVFVQLKNSMDAMFHIPPDPDATWMSLITDRFFSFTMVLGTGFLLLVSLVISTVLSAMVTWLGDLSGAEAVVVMGLNFVVGVAFTTLLFAAIFRFVPTVQPLWGDVWPGAVLAAFLFSIGRIVLGWYLGSGTVGSAYGAAASLVIVLAWVYYSAQIMFLGAEFTFVYGAHRRSRAALADFARQEADAAGAADAPAPDTTATGTPHVPAPAGRPARAVDRARPQPHAEPSAAIAGVAAMFGAAAILAALRRLWSADRR